VTSPRNRSKASRAGHRASRRPREKIQLLIVDEHPLLRAGVRTLLESETEVEVVAEADTVDQALEACRDGEVDVVLMDVDQATSEAVDDMRRLREGLPEDGALVVLARRADDEGVYQAVVGGAAGHVGEDAQPRELVETIKQAASGDEPIRRTLAERPHVGRRVLEAFAQLRTRMPSRRETRLSEREITILRLASEGMTNYQIGRSLGISEHTVKSAISMILARLGLRHRTEAVVHALRNGWISSPSVTSETAAEQIGGRLEGPGVN
jgi:two-component system response regulator DegU